MRPSVSLLLFLASACPGAVLAQHPAQAGPAPGEPAEFDRVVVTATRTARSVFPLAEKASDEPTADLLTQRLQVHEKTAWMLRSLLA